MKKDKEFLALVMKGDNQIINDLKQERQLKNILDDSGKNIIHYLIAGNQIQMTEYLIENKLINYNLLKNTINDLVKNHNYKQDNYFLFFKLLKDVDKEKIITKNINQIIKNNNSKTINSIDFKILENNKIDFLTFTLCNDEMLENCLPYYKNQIFNLTDLKYGFYQLRLNKIRTSILMENLNIKISPIIYEELNRVNEYCVMYLENRDLYNKLDIKLEQKIIKENKILKKI